MKEPADYLWNRRR